MAHRFLITCCLLILLGCSSSEITSLDDLGVSDWAALQAKLAADVPQTLRPDESVYDRILDSRTAKAVNTRGTRSLWLSMCSSGEPLVSLLGFRCVAENLPDDSFQAALATLANRGSNSLYAFAEPLRCVNEAKASDENKAAFTQFVTDPKNGNLKLNEVTAFLDETFLYDWAVGADLSSVPASVQTLAVGQVYSVSNDKGSVIPDSVAATFNSFEKHSGDRLAVFVWYAPASIDEPRLRDAIERLLQDDEVSTGMYQLALHQRIDFIKNHIDTAKLQLSPAHQQRYDGFRESAGKRNGA